MWICSLSRKCITRFSKPRPFKDLSTTGKIFFVLNGTMEQTLTSKNLNNNFKAIMQQAEKECKQQIEI